MTAAMFILFQLGVIVVVNILTGVGLALSVGGIAYLILPAIVKKVKVAIKE